MDNPAPPSPELAPPARRQDGHQNGQEAAPERVLFAPPGAPAWAPARHTAPRLQGSRRAWPGWERLTRLLLAFTIASLLWFYVLNLENPAGAATYTLIPLSARGLAQNLSLATDLGTVTITAQAPQDILARLRSTDFSPTVDLSGRGPGTFQLPVQVAAPPNVLSVVPEPATVQVQIIEVSEQTFPIQVRPQGVPAIGYSIETQQVRPTNVVVRGPRDQVARIDQVVAEVDVEGRQGTQQGDVQPRALDFAGHEIAGLQFTPSAVTVVIAIQQLLNYKTLPIHVPVEGIPAQGYGVTAIVVEPTTLTAYGSPTLLEPLSFLETTPITITGATETVRVSEPVSLPRGLTLYPPGTANRVQVSVQIAQLTTKIQLSVLVRPDGLAPGLLAIASPDRVDVTISGPFEALQDFKPDSVQAGVDLATYGVGTFRLVPQVSLPPGLKVEATAPSEVTVTISALPTATPLPSPTATFAPPTPAPPTATAHPPETIPGLPPASPTGAPAPPGPSATPSATSR